MFVEHLLNGSDWPETPGILYREESDRIHRNPLPDAVDLDTCSTTLLSAGLIGDIEITRGCYYGCGYCQTPKIFRGPVRHRSLKSIMAEARKLPRFIHFISPNALCYGADGPGKINEKAIVEMLGALRREFPEKQITFGLFPSEVRPDYVRKNLLREIKPLIDNRYLAVGVQSASDHVLQIANRKHTVADVERAIETLLTEGFDVLMDFIFGLPGEDARAVDQNIRFLQRWISPRVRIRSHLFTPLPGTPFRNEPAGTLHPALREFMEKHAARKTVTGRW